MADFITTVERVTVGLDVSDKHSQVCVLDSEGDVMEESKIRTTPEGLTNRFKTMSPARVALEVGTHSAWVHRLLEELGHEVIVANARKLRMIFQSDTKNDKADALMLAKLARMDPELLSPIEHRSAQAQQDLAILRARDALVRTRSKLINHVRGAVKSMGGRIGAMSSHTFGNKAEGQLPECLRPALQPVLEAIRKLTEQIRQEDGAAEEAAKLRYPQTQALQQISGVGAVTSLAYVLTLGDASRFQSSRQVGAYLGLRPRQSQSGERDPELRITKAGDGLLRRLLVTSAHYILGPFGPDTDLRRWGLKLASGGKTAKKRAVVAVARKLAVLLHRLWMSGEAYDPLRNAAKSEKVEAKTVGK